MKTIKAFPFGKTSSMNSLTETLLWSQHLVRDDKREKTSLGVIFYSPIDVVLEGEEGCEEIIGEKG